MPANPKKKLKIIKVNHKVLSLGFEKSLEIQSASIHIQRISKAGANNKIMIHPNTPRPNNPPQQLLIVNK